MYNQPTTGDTDGIDVFSGTGFSPAITSSSPLAPTSSDTYLSSRLYQQQTPPIVTQHRSPLSSPQMRNMDGISGTENSSSISNATSSAYHALLSSDAVNPETFITSSSTVLRDNTTNSTPTLTNNATTLTDHISFTFAGKDNAAISGFECSLDANSANQSQTIGAFSCANRVMIGNLSQGNHTFQVVAIDSSGNRDPTPAGFSWHIVSANNATLH